MSHFIQIKCQLTVPQNIIFIHLLVFIFQKFINNTHIPKERKKCMVQKIIMSDLHNINRSKSVEDKVMTYNVH